MANSQVDRNVNIMKKEQGTVCLITDVSSDRYLRKLPKIENIEASELQPPACSETQIKFSKFCGGAGGFDDYSEHWLM
jgi:hypothetical protein